MAVEKVEALSVSGRIDELDSVTEALGKTNYFAPDNALSFYSDTTGFTPVNAPDPYAKPLSSLADSLKQIGLEEKLNGLDYSTDTSLPVKDWEKYSSDFSTVVQGILKKEQQCEEEIRRCDEEISRVQHFSWLKINLDDLNGCQFVKTRFGSLPAESYAEMSQYKKDTFLALFSKEAENSLYWGMYCAPINQIEETDHIFSHLGFEAVSLKGCSGTIPSILERDASSKQKASEELDGVSSEIKAFWDRECGNFLGVYTWLSKKHTYYGIRRYAFQYGNSFILVGWIPVKRMQEVQGALKPLSTVIYTMEDASKPDILPHSPPTTLKNRKLWRPFEYLISIYGLPSYDEFDPTAIVAFTYVLLFGLMFADFGQGLVIALAGWLLWKKKRSGLGCVMIPCGISSSVIGVLFGSCFGFENSFDWLYKGILKLPDKPISVMEQTNSVILFAVGLGILMVILAIITNIIVSLRRKHYTEGLFGPNGVAGLIFYTSVIVGFGGQLAFGWNIVNSAYIFGLIVLPLIVILFREVLGGFMEGKPDWKPEHWGGTIMQSLFEVFEFILSYLTNTISFIRVGAFVLVHAGMMSVVFTLAEMFSGVGFAIVVFIGNAFIIALEGLLSGVQSLRLEFYEMFSRFYNGSGHPFIPVTVGRKA